MIRCAAMELPCNGGAYVGPGDSVQRPTCCHAPTENQGRPAPADMGPSDMGHISPIRVEARLHCQLLSRDWTSDKGNIVIFGRRFALDPFLKANPPSRHVVPAPREMATAYRDIVPVALVDVWRHKGLGLYGKYQLALIDPRQWQPILDRWIVSPPDDVRRSAARPLSVILH
ncbi:GAD-like domain-containing protein [Sphingomonas sp. ASY06-1R]|uniref:GAD-like domain-containing protein n=1 Tax=Sphingomonas sp. ASY06-1R TaxID=3445771 RepID=UPI003FA2294C